MLAADGAARCTLMRGAEILVCHDSIGRQDACPTYRYSRQPRSSSVLTTSRIASSWCLSATSVASGVWTTIVSLRPSVTTRCSPLVRTIVAAGADAQMLADGRVAAGVAADGAGHRLPAANVVPGERRFDDDDGLIVLHHGEVDRLAADRGELAVEHFGELRLAQVVLDDFQVVAHGRLDAASASRMVRAFQTKMPLFQ